MNRKANKTGQETSVQSYLEILDDLMQKNDWVVEATEWLEAIKVGIGKYWGPDDLRLIRGRPKWLNEVDWAKVVARKLPVPILTRTATVLDKKFTMLVRDDTSTDPEWLAYVKARPVKSGFKRACPNCGKNIPLSKLICPFCDSKMPKRSARILRRAQ